MSVFNFYVDTSTIDDRNKAEIILDTPIQTQPNEYLEVKVIDVSLMNDNYNISSSLNNNEFIINRKQILNTPVKDDPVVISLLFNSIDFYQTAGGNSLLSSVTRSHHDGYEKLSNGTFCIYYYNTHIEDDSSTNYINNIFDNQNITEEVWLSNTNESYFVVEDVLNTGYLFEDLDVSISHDGRAIANTTTFTFKVAYSNDNINYNQFEVANNTLTFQAHSNTQLETTLHTTITLTQNNTPRLYKYLKVFFEVDGTITDGVLDAEYHFVKLRFGKADYTLTTTTPITNQVITIPDGFYNSTNFITTLNSLLLSYNLVLSINSITNKLLIQNNNSSFTYSLSTPNDLNNELKLILNNNLLKRLFGMTADETTLPKNTITTSNNALNLLHYQKLVLTTDLTFNVPTTHLLKEWKEDKADGMRNILIWCSVDEPPYTIIKYKNYEGLSYRINDTYIKNLNFYFYNEFKQSVDINRLLFHIQIIKKNISYY